VQLSNKQTHFSQLSLITASQSCTLEQNIKQLNNTITCYIFNIATLCCSLRVLHVHNNHLTSLPDELVGVKCLNSLALAFNRFASLPAVAAQMTNIRLTDVECVSIAGNNIEKLTSVDLAEMKYARRADLRLNSLTLPTTDTLKFTVLERLTHLNVSDNRIKELDLHSLRMLEYLNCERNAMTSLHLNGATLRTLFAADNSKLVVSQLAHIAAIT